eukprot:2202471-Lingulodinium_polyedra.AAC.1
MAMLMLMIFLMLIHILMLMLMLMLKLMLIIIIIRRHCDSMQLPPDAETKARACPIHDSGGPSRPSAFA